MTPMKQVLGPKHPAELKLVRFEFGGELELGETIAAAAVGVAVASGEDAAPGAMLVGLPLVSGSSVVQRIGGGVDGCSYRVTAQVDGSTGLKHVVQALLSVSQLL